MGRPHTPMPTLRPTCKVKQCFCYHTGTQCNASQTCGYCTGQHESEARIPATTAQAQTTNQRPEDTTTEPTGAFTSVDTEPQAPPLTNRSTNLSTAQAVLQAQTPLRAQTPSGAMSMQSSVVPSTGETSAIQQGPAQQLDPTINHQIPATKKYPLNGLGRGFATENMTSNIDGERVYNMAELAPSPPTSMATGTRTALGKIYKGCKCPSHQEIYSDWPTHNAELIVGRCMKICVYCGNVFPTAGLLRRHLKTMKYARRNLTVCEGERGGFSTTAPGWIPRPLTLNH